MNIVGIAHVTGALALEDTHELHIIGTICPSWCAGGCTAVDGLALTGRIHEKTLAALTAPEAEAGDPTDVRLRIERHDADGDSETRVVLGVGRADVPSIDQVDVEAYTGGYTDRQCRALLAAYLAGVFDRTSVELTPAELRELARAATAAADLAEQSR